MKITIITISYNNVHFIEQTIKSVLSQSYNDIEYIIIDGGSTDGTKEIIQRYADKLKFWCSEPDNGIYDAMNKGIIHASGDWVNFMNSGDCFSSSIILSEFNLSKNSDKIKVVYGDVQMVYSDHSIMRKAYPLRTMSYRMPFCHQATFVRREILKKYMFDLQYRIGADYKLFYSIYYSLGPAAFKYLPICVAKCDATDSLSQKNKYPLWKEYIKIRSANKDTRWYYDSFKLYIKNLLGYGK